MTSVKVVELQVSCSVDYGVVFIRKLNSIRALPAANGTQTKCFDTEV